MKKIFKKILAMALCCAMLVPMGALGASAATAKETETDCGGKCKHSPVIVLPGINHSPTYLYDENDEPYMYNDSHVGGTLIILNEAALSAGAIVKAVAAVLGTLALQTNLGLDKIAYNLVSEIFKFQKCDETATILKTSKLRDGTILLNI